MPDLLLSIFRFFECYSVGARRSSLRTPLCGCSLPHFVDSGLARF